MANLDGTVHDIVSLSQPRVKTITTRDLTEALLRG